MVQHWNLGSVLKEWRHALVGFGGRWVGEGVLFSSFPTFFPFSFSFEGKIGSEWVINNSFIE